LQNIKGAIDHFKQHQTYPATKEELAKECNELSDFSAEDKQWFMKNLPEGSRVLFDGIPRKMEQAESFDALMVKLGRDFTGVVIELDETVAIQRLTTRRICEGCKAVYPAEYTKKACEACGGKLVIRNDDANMESIQNRLKAYREETVPVVAHYKNLGKIIEVDGTPAIETVTHVLVETLDPVFLR